MEDVSGNNRTTHIYIWLSRKIYSVHKTLSAAQGKVVITTAIRKWKCNSCGGTGITGLDFNNDAYIVSIAMGTGVPINFFSCMNEEKVGRLEYLPTY